MFTIGCGWYSNASAAEARFVALPRIENHTIAPRLIYVENPRFPTVDVSAPSIVSDSAADLVQEHLGVAMKRPGTIRVLQIDDVFGGVVERKSPDFGALIGDFRRGAVDWERVRRDLREQIEKQPEPLSEQIRFARAYLVQPLQAETFEQFAHAVAETFESRSLRWTIATLEDGHPVIGKAPGLPDLPYNEHAYWALMIELGIDAEIILTNQLVASVEYSSVPVHCSLRGGITGGSTEYNPSSLLGTSVWVSLSPYPSGDRGIVELRRGRSYSRDQALFYAAIMLAHEIGHQLFQLGHPWSNGACLMRPVEALDFASWAEKRNAGACKIGSSPAMTPGAVKAPIW